MGRQLLLSAMILVVLVSPSAALIDMQDMASVAMSGDGMSLQQHSHDDGQSLHTAGAEFHDHAMMDAHDHSAAECDEYCMNCSSHCSSTAIVSSGSPFPVSASQPHRVAAGATADRAYLLFRPPIHS